MTHHNPNLEPVDSIDPLDAELAAFVDGLLRGPSAPSIEISPQNAELAQLSRQVQRLIAPDSPPSPVFRARLAARLDAEWDLAQNQSNKPKSVPLRAGRVFITPHTRRLLGIAALVAVLFAVVLALASSSGAIAPTATAGAAIGTLTPEFAIFFGVLLAIGLAIGLSLWLRRRR